MWESPANTCLEVEASCGRIPQGEERTTGGGGGGGGGAGICMESHSHSSHLSCSH